MNKLSKFSNQINSVFLRSSSMSIQYNFSQPKSISKPISQSVKQLQQILLTQTKLQLKNKHDTIKYKQLLESIGWLITKKDATLQMQKQTKTHKFRTFITIKPPIQINPQIKSSLIRQKEFQIGVLEETFKEKKDFRLKKWAESMKQYLLESPLQQNMVQITVFVQKLNSYKEKHLCVQFLANSRFATVQNFTLWSKVLPKRIQRLQDCHQYIGRGITRMNIDQGALLTRQIEEEWDLRKQVLTTMFELTVCYQQEEYIQWLNNFDEVL